MSWIVSRKVSELATVKGGGSVTWTSRQPTAEAALEEASLLWEIPTSQLRVVSEAEIDWSESGNVQGMRPDGSFA